MKIILASKSPRRIEILNEILHNNDFKILPQDVNEDMYCDSPQETAKMLAEKKLNNLNNIYPDCVIISADTLVYYKGKYFPKPKDKNQAFQFLKELKGEFHSVITGVCVAKGNKVVTNCEESQVKIKEMSDSDIEDYIDICNPLDKAGSYGIQDNFLKIELVGSYSNVVGLPKKLLKEMLIQIGVFDNGR